MKNLTENHLRILKNSKLRNFFLKYCLRLISFLLLIVITLFLSSKILIINQIQFLSFFLIAVVFLFSVIKFFYESRKLFKQNWSYQLIGSLDGENKKYQDKLYNIHDLSGFEKLSLNEGLYLNALDSSIEIEKERFQFERLFKYLAISLSIIFILLLMDPSFKDYLSVNIFSIKEENKYFLNIETEKNLTLAIDSIVVVNYKHNIPGLNTITLETENKKGVKKLVTLSTRKKEFKFSYKELKEGLFYLKGKSGIIGEVISDSVNFKFIDAISIIKHRVRINYPNYTKLPTEIINNIYDIKVLKGSRINWNLDLNKRTDIIKSNFYVADSTDLLFTKRIFKKNEYFRVKVSDYENQHFEFKSDTFSLTIDQKPVVLIRNPGKSTNRASLDPIELVLAGFDDFGFKKIEMLFFYEDKELGTKSDLKKKVILEDQPKSFIKQVNWDLSSTNLFPGMDLYFKIIAFDNNTVDGFQQSETEWHHVHFLTLEEMYKEINQEQENLEKEIFSQIDERKKISSELEKLYLKAKQKGKLSENDNKQLNSLLNKLEKLNRKLRDAEKNLTKIEKKMTEENLFNEETVSKYNEIKELMNELKNFLKQNPVKKNLEKSSNQQNDLKSFAKKEKNIQSQLERMKSLLNKLRDKRKNDFILKEIQNFKKEQGRVNNELKRDKENSKKNQKGLQNKVEKFLKRNTGSKLGDKAKNLFKQEQVLAKMKEQQNELSHEKGKEITESFQRIEEKLQKEISKSEKAEKNEFLKQMDLITSRLIDLSIFEEELYSKTNHLSAYSSRYRNLAKQQDLINKKLSYLSEETSRLANQSFLFNPKISQVLNSAIDNNFSAISSLEQRQSRQAHGKQIEAMGLINQAILMMQQNKKSMSSASSALGEKEFQKMMQKMAQGQQGINSESESLWDMLKEQSAKGSSDQRLSGKERLSNDGEKREGKAGKESKASGEGGGLGKRQSDLAKQLENLLDRIGRSGKQGKGKSGRVSEMIKEMKKISEELNKDKINKDLINRQRKLLKKMLDAASAGKEKDEKKKKREKEEAKDFEVQDVKDIRKDFGENDIYLQEQLEKAMRKNFDPSIKKLIQHYYNNLINLKTDSL